MRNGQGLLSRAFEVCLMIFVAALLLHVAVQLLEGIKWWLVGGLVAAAIAVLITTAVRYRRDRW